MAKIILTNGQTETLVATFKSTLEAFQAAALFQAILHPGSNYQYIVDFKERGTSKRRQPDSLTNTVNSLTYLREHLKPIF